MIGHGSRNLSDLPKNASNNKLHVDFIYVTGFEGTAQAEICQIYPRMPLTTNLPKNASNNKLHVEFIYVT